MLARTKSMLSVDIHAPPRFVAGEEWRKLAVILLGCEELII